MHPYYFGDSEAPLFGAYHPPASAHVRDAAVLLCQPLAQEYMRAHRVMGQLAARLASVGYHVLRFDYTGMGDSSGDFEHADASRWISDVRTAVEELRATSGAGAVSVVGLRFGAALATASLPGNVRIQDLVLWDPVTRGDTYLAELERMQEQDGNPSNRRSSGADADELLGFPFSESVRSSIVEMTAMASMPISAERLLLLTSEERTEYASLRDRIERQGVPVSYEILPNPIGWDRLDKLRSIIVVPDAVDAIAEFLGAHG